MKKILLFLSIILAIKSYGENEGILFFTKGTFGNIKEKNVNYISDVGNSISIKTNQGKPEIVATYNPVANSKPYNNKDINSIIWIEGKGIKGREYINGEDEIIKSSKKYSGMRGIKDAKIINNGWVECGENNSIGISSEGESLGVNRGVIYISTLYDKGMVALNKAKSINDAHIYLIGEYSCGMLALNNGILENNMDIYCIDPYTIGMKLENNSQMINNGYIIVRAKGSSGIDLNTTCPGVNNGKIRIVNGYGTRIFGNGQFINKGNIICDENGYGTGVSLIKNGQFINRGNMIINNGEVVKLNRMSKVINEGNIDVNKGIVANFKTGGTFINDNIINLKNKKMLKIAVGPGSFINNGKIVGNGEVSRDSKFYLEKTGKIEGNNFKGNIYIGKSIFKDNCDEIIKLDNNLMVKNYQGKILIDNPLYTDTTEKTSNGYRITLKRKTFKSIVRKKDKGVYLDKNYKNGHSERNLLFNQLKECKTTGELNSAVEDLLGDKIYTSMGPITKGIIDFNRNTLYDEVYSQSNQKSLRWIGGYAYSDKKIKSIDTLYGYREKIQSVYLGSDKKINKNIRGGVIITIGKSKNNFSNNSSRKDNIVQGDLFLIYTPWKSIEYIGNLSYGGTSGSIDRKINVGEIHKKYHSHLNNRYFSFNNRIEKTFNFGSYYIIPGIEGDYTRINQGSINEKGNYGLSLKKVQYNFIQGGPRITLGKTFPLGKYYKLNCEVTGKYTHEFLQGYRKTQSKMTSFSPDSYNISKYNGRKNTGLGVLKLTLIRGGFSIYGAYNCGGDMGNLGTVGLVYKF